MLSIEGVRNSFRSVFSQFGEDGVIEYVFDNIGTTNNYCIEFGAANGASDSNTLNLRMHDWNSLLLDRKKKRMGYSPKTKKRILDNVVKRWGYKGDFLKLLNLFFSSKCIRECLRHKNGKFSLIKIWRKILYKERSTTRVLKSAKYKNFNRKAKFSESDIVNVLKLFYVFNAWITAENIMDIFKSHDVPESFDLLSIDVDGNDYWIWNSITVRPRMVIVEFNSSIDPEESKVIPYDPSFKYNYNNYFGASLLAFKRLGKSKGYSLIHQNAPFNAFFVLSDLLPENMRDIPIKEMFPKAVPHPKLLPCPKNKKWLEVK